jgi:DNA repair photolyase
MIVLMQRKTPMGRNPQTGQAIKIPAEKAMKLRVAKTGFKEKEARQVIRMSFTGWQKTTIKTSQGDVEGIAPVIISASRATDIPALYSDWFIHRLTQGYVKWINRFNGQPRYVSFEKARAFVFWTKNSEPAVKYLHELDSKNLNYYFTYTLNDYEADGIEPNVPPLVKRIETFKRLSYAIGKEKVVWRFDPLILSKKITTDKLLEKIHGVGSKIHSHTEKLVISFIDFKLYKKVQQNLRTVGFKDCKEFTPEDIIKIATGLQEMNKEWNLQIATCAEATDLSEYGIAHNKCIDADLLIRLFNHDKELMDFLGYVPPESGLLPFIDPKGKSRPRVLKDLGQRKDCGCIPSKDIGQYGTCVHGCAYCYANASPEIAQRNFQRHRSLKEYSEAILQD